MRADRLLSILLCLQTAKKMNTSELATKLEVSERTILRDMDALSAAGVPVFSERGAGGGWRLMEGYQTDLTGLKKAEIQALLLASATQILGDLGMRANYNQASLKLLASLPEAVQQDAAKVRQRIHVDGAGWHQVNELVPCLPIMQDAIWAERSLRLTYMRDGEQVEKLVDPLGIVVKGTIWYLVALLEGEYRTYRVSRILQAVITEQAFTRPDTFELAAYWGQSTKEFKENILQYPALLKVKSHVLPRLQKERFLTVKEIMERLDEWISVAVDYQSLESAFSFVMSCGADIEVMEPVSLRDKVHEAALAIVGVYTM